MHLEMSAILSWNQEINKPINLFMKEFAPSIELKLLQWGALHSHIPEESNFWHI